MASSVPMQFILPSALALILCAACGPTTSPNPGPDGGVAQSPDSGSSEECAGKGLANVPATGPAHTATCTDACGNGVVPPTGGAHCAQWLACRVYDQAQPLCNWVHNLEHGHAVLLYNCPSGCPEIVNALTAIWTSAGANGTKRRILLTPYPQLDAKVAAVVWGWSWKGEVVDDAAIRCLLGKQDVDAPEPGLSCVQ